MCSPTTLFVDITMWLVPGVVQHLEESYRTLSRGDPYDCGLTSVPCESNITKALINSDPTLTFWFDLIFVYIVLTVLVLFGIFGNVVNIIIFSTNNIVSDSTNNLILALAVSDLVNLSCVALVITSGFLCFVDESIALTFFSIIFSQSTFITRWFSVLSLDLVAVIAIQRAVAVVFPFKISTIFSRRNTNIIITVLFVICVFTMIPMSAAVDPRWIFHPYFNKYISLGLHLRLDYRSMADYTFYCYNCRSALDLFLICTTGFLTVHTLNKQAKHRASLKADTSTQKMSVRESKAIKMSLAICLATFIIYSLIITVNGTTDAYVEELFKSPFSSISENSLLFLVAVNSSFNFFLYIGMSDQYRDIILNCFKHTCNKNNK